VSKAQLFVEVLVISRPGRCVSTLSGGTQQAHRRRLAHHIFCWVLFCSTFMDLMPVDLLPADFAQAGFFSSTLNEGGVGARHRPQCITSRLSASPFSFWCD